MRAAIVTLPLVLLSGCFVGDEFSLPTEDDVIRAGERCGVSGLKPTWEAEGSILEYNVPENLRDAQAKRDCIEADLKRQGFYS